MDQRPLAVVALLLVLAARLFWLDVERSAAGVDYYQCWLVGRSVAADEAGNVYSPDGRARLAQLGRGLAAADPDARRLASAVAFRTNIETFSTPVLYGVVGVLGTGDYELDLTVFHALGLLSALSGATLLCRLLGCTALMTGLMLLTLLICSDPLASDARVANVNSLQLAGVAAYLWLVRGVASTAREVSAGAVLALLVLFKPTLGLGVVFLAFGWIADRRWRTMRVQGLALAATSVIAVALSSVYLRSAHAWLDWLASLRGLERVSDVSVVMGNFSVARAASELGAFELSTFLLPVVVLAMALCTWRGTRRSPDVAYCNDRDFLALALGCAMSLIALRLAWLHYYLLLLPLIVYLFRRRASRGVALAAIGLATVCVLGTPLRVILPAVAMYVQAPSYLIGSLVLAAFGLAEVARGAPRA